MGPLCEYAIEEIRIRVLRGMLYELWVPEKFKLFSHRSHSKMNVCEHINAGKAGLVNQHEMGRRYQPRETHARYPTSDGVRVPLLGDCITSAAEWSRGGVAECRGGVWEKEVDRLVMSELHKISRTRGDSCLCSQLRRPLFQKCSDSHSYAISGHLGQGSTKRTQSH